MIRKLAALVVAAMASLLQPVAAEAGVNAIVDLSAQRVDVYVNGALRHRWPTSTGRRGYRTPTGSYRPKRLERQWYSRKYYWSPMPYSVFFRGGYAIHGTTETHSLGRPASHGCVRLRTAHARTLFELVERYGMKRTRIIVRQ
jgi:lipoprotein-anchoring transpeptidase ErfK/SrfK